MNSYDIKIVHKATGNVITDNDMIMEAETVGQARDMAIEEVMEGNEMGRQEILDVYTITVTPI